MQKFLFINCFITKHLTELIRINIGEILKVGHRTPYETSLHLKVLKLTDKKCFFRELSMIYGRENLWCVAISEP